MFGGRSTDCRQCRRMSGNDLGLLTIGRRMRRVLTPVVAGPVCSMAGYGSSHGGKSLKAGFDHRSTFVSERVDGTGAHGRGSYRQHSPTVVSPLSGRRSLRGAWDWWHEGVGKGAGGRWQASASLGMLAL